MVKMSCYFGMPKVNVIFGYELEIRTRNSN